LTFATLSFSFHDPLPSDIYPLSLHDALPIFNPAQLACFLAFWAVNMAVIYLGIESIRLLLNIKAPLLVALGLALLAWAYREANRSEEHTSELQSRRDLVCRLLLEKKKKYIST